MKIVIEGLEEIRAKLRQYPQQYERAAQKTMDASLLTIQGSVPGYPSPPASSDYIRTGTLGRTLGSGGGRAEVYEVRSGGGGYIEGEIGTNLEYAPYVIGENTQAWMHQGRWWTFDGTVLKSAVPKIERLWQIMVEELAKWLDAR